MRAQAIACLPPSSLLTLLRRILPGVFLLALLMQVVLVQAKTENPVISAPPSPILQQGQRHRVADNKLTSSLPSVLSPGSVTLLWGGNDAPGPGSVGGANTTAGSTTRVDRLLNTTTLGINPHTGTLITSPVSVEVTLALTMADANGVVGAATNVVLTVSYNPATGTTYTERNSYVDVNHYVVEALVGQIRVDNGSGYQVVTAAPDYVTLYLSLEIDRVYQMPLTDLVSSMTIADTDLSGALAVGSSAGHYTLNASDAAFTLDWSGGEIAEAEYYELEWTYIDDYMASVGGYTAHSLQEFDFNQHSTRVMVQGTSYQMSHTFDKGYVIFRVRAVGNPKKAVFDGIEETYYEWGNWSVPDKGTIAAQLAGGLAGTNGASFVLEVTEPHATLLNWQYTATFIEDGKKKEVIGYYDGSLHGRQTQTLASQEGATETQIAGGKEVIVQESIYDFLGRPALNLLPAPAGTHILGYIPNFNLVNASSPRQADWRDLNQDNPTDSCGFLGMPQFLNTSGANRYYSASNPDKSQFNAYIPVANGYAYSAVQYAPDNSGRIVRQGGVGTELRLYGGHDTQFRYSRPHQNILNEFLGTNAGYDVSYLQTASIDPNGQASVAISDAHGRTVATFLTGESPANVTSLPSNTGVVIQRENLLTSDTIDFSINAIVASIDKSFFEDTTYVKFEYSIDPAQFRDTTCIPDFCYDCVYDFSLTVTDLSCGRVIHEVITTINMGEIDFTCADGSGAISLNAGDSVLFTSGTYRIRKELKVNLAAAEKYADHYLAMLDTTNSDCIESYEDILNSIKTGLHYEDCEGPDSLASLTSCSSLYSLMLSDVSPGGRYGRYVKNSAGTVVTPVDPAGQKEFTYSLYNSSYNFYTTAPGQPLLHTTNQINGGSLSYTELWKHPLKGAAGTGSDSWNPLAYSYDPGTQDPATMTVEEFTTLFQPEWAERLVRYHPDYCRYEGCLQKQQYQAFADDIQELVSNQDLAVYASGKGQTYTSPVSWLQANDPLIKSATAPSGFPASQLSAILGSTHALTGSSLNLKQTTLYMTYCQTSGSFPDPFVLCSGAPTQLFQDSCHFDTEWQIYRDLYLSERERLLIAHFQTGPCWNWPSAYDPGNVQNTLPDSFPDSRFASFKDADIDTDDGPDPGTVGDSLLSDCHDKCASYRLGWETALKEMNARCGVPALGNIPAILDSLEAVCAGGCDPQHPLGTTVWGTKSFATVLAAHGVITDVNNSSFNIACSQYALPYPQAPNVPLDEYPLAVPRLDTCACKKILTADHEWHLNDSLGTSAADYFQTLYGTALPRFGSFVCDCKEVYEEVSSVAWTPGAAWTQVHADSLLADSIAVPAFIGCGTCKTCEEVTNAYAALKLGQQEKDGNEPAFARAMNAYLGANHGWWEYEDFMEGCEVNAAVTEITENDWSSFFWYSTIPASDGTYHLGKSTYNGVKLVVHKVNKDNTTAWTKSYIPGAINDPVYGNYTFTHAGGYSYGVALDNGKVLIIYDIIPNIMQSLLAAMCINSDGTIAWSKVYGDGTIFTAINNPADNLFTNNSASANIWGVSLSDPDTVTVAMQYTSDATFLLRIELNGGNLVSVGGSLREDTKFARWGRKGSIVQTVDSGYAFAQRGGVWPSSVTGKIIFSKYSANNIAEWIGEIFPTINGTTFYPVAGTATMYGQVVQLSGGDYVVMMQDFLGGWDGGANAASYSRTEASPLVIRFSLNGTTPVLKWIKNYDAQNIKYVHPAVCSLVPTKNDDILINIGGQYNSTTFSYASEILLVNGSTGTPVWTYTFPGLYSYQIAKTDDPNKFTILSGTKDSYLYMTGNNVSFTGCIPESSGNITVRDNITNNYAVSFTQNTNLPSSPVYSVIPVLTLPISTNTYTPAPNYCSLPRAVIALDYSCEGDREVVVTLVKASAPSEVASGTRISSLGPLTNADFQPGSTSNWHTLLTGGAVSLPTYNSSGVLTGSSLSVKLRMTTKQGRMLAPSLSAFTNTCATLCTEGYTAPISDPVADCIAYKDSLANEYARLRYLEIRKNKRAEVLLAYFDKCLRSAAETGFMTYASREYHATLYHYDLGGNLVATVPPHGAARRPAADSTLINNGRATGTRVVPQHSMASLYWYNSLNQLVKQNTPDGGESRFWYDALGRIILSQNQKQLGDNTYSYTRYDALGRVYEAGELTGGTGVNAPNNSNDPNITAWVTTYLPTRTQYSQTYYDAPPAGTAVPAEYVQRNLRTRVACAVYTDATNSAHYTYYSYDIRGNVEAIVQRFPELAGQSREYVGMRYHFDELSGNVRKLDYQQGKGDQFLWEYTYDGENRLQAAYSSRDRIHRGAHGAHYDLDARYRYYRHGPLARVEIGEQQVQGIDFAYTIQGWIKGVNSSVLDPTRDMGHDGQGVTGNTNRKFARDAFGFVPGYHTNDYEAIGWSGTSNTTWFEARDSWTRIGKGGMWNGNISSMAQGIGTSSGILGGGSRLYVYNYDQLNRLLEAKAWEGEASNSWSAATATTAHQNTWTYDAAGNILTQNRNNQSSVAIDQLTYRYGTGLKKNQLGYIDDAITTTVVPGELTDQANGNYTYDAIGNLIYDHSEGGGTTIEWDVRGKITAVIKQTGMRVEYAYDALGQRVRKTVKTGPTEDTWVHTYYVRDAQGNALAVYESALTGSSGIYTETLTAKEFTLYGSTRLGVHAANEVLLSRTWAGGTFNPAGIYSRYGVPTVVTNTLNTTGVGGNSFYVLARGKKKYELSNYLGNVLAVISDRKLQQATGWSASLGTYAPDVLSYTDYYAFGWEMPGRNGGNYRYGFNGQEEDPEFWGGAVSFEYRVMDARVGRFFSVDPIMKQYPWYTPYQVAGNTVIQSRELEGKEPEWMVDYAYFLATMERAVVVMQAGINLDAGVHFDKGKGFAVDPRGNVGVFCFQGNGVSNSLGMSLGYTETYLPISSKTGVYDVTAASGKALTRGVAFSKGIFSLTPYAPVYAYDSKGKPYEIGYSVGIAVGQGSNYLPQPNKLMKTDFGLIEDVAEAFMLVLSRAEYSGYHEFKEYGVSKAFDRFHLHERNNTGRALRSPIAWSAEVSTAYKDNKNGTYSLIYKTYVYAFDIRTGKTVESQTYYEDSGIDVKVKDENTVVSTKAKTGNTQ